ncbi:MAG: 2-hydroxyacid dehydrogenase [Calditrichaeota bacterium]|nr:MAG: 2-hydroxyacid dehydrogenase [Calditrichota bacterium]
MKVAVFSTKSYDREFLDQANRRFGHELVYFEPHLRRETALLAQGFPAVCVFVNDTLDAETLARLAEGGTRLIALRCAGFNNVDLPAADRLGFTVVRVPAYSPHAVAEHTVALLLAVDRQIHRAYNRVREGNFALEGLLGWDLHGQTVGIIGTGKIGRVVAKILNGFGCRLLAYDPYPDPECRALGVDYVPLESLFARSDIITLHCPLTPQTHHLIDDNALKQMKDGVVLINTSRGALVDTRAVIRHLKSGKIGHLALDVYEEEADLFFEDLSNQVIQDDVFARLLTFPNVLITAHQAFFTRNALENIAQTTLQNIADVEQGRPCPNLVTLEMVARG